MHSICVEEIQIDSYVAALSNNKDTWYFGQVTENNIDQEEFNIHMFSPDGMSATKCGYRRTSNTKRIAKLSDIMKVLKTFKPTTKAGRFFNLEAFELKEIEDIFFNITDADDSNGNYDSD